MKNLNEKKSGVLLLLLGNAGSWEGGPHTDRICRHLNNPKLNNFIFFLFTTKKKLWKLSNSFNFPVAYKMNVSLPQEEIFASNISRWNFKVQWNNRPIIHISSQNSF